MQKRNPTTVFFVISASQSPCYGCSDRHTLCHTRCEKYKAWIADLRDKGKHERSENAYRFYLRDKITEKEQRIKKGTNTYKRHYRRR